MITRYAVWLDKKSLEAVDPSIYILDISYGSPRFDVNTSDKPGRNGQHVTSRYARSTSVTISLEIHEQDIARRQDVCRRIQQWAMKGGILTTNDRKGQRLRVICENPPAIDSALKWTKKINIGFTAYEQPFWEDEFPRSVTLSGTSASKSLYAPGFCIQTRVEATVKNNSNETINALTLNAGGTTMNFESLSLASGKTLEIGYDEDGLLFIRIDGTSKMSCRTAESSDDLLIETGKQETVSVMSSEDVTVTFKARGLYM